MSKDAFLNSCPTRLSRCAAELNAETDRYYGHWDQLPFARVGMIFDLEYLALIARSTPVNYNLKQAVQDELEALEIDDAL